MLLMYETLKSYETWHNGQRRPSSFKYRKQLKSASKHILCELTLNSQFVTKQNVYKTQATLVCSV